MGKQRPRQPTPITQCVAPRLRAWSVRARRLEGLPSPSVPTPKDIACNRARAPAACLCQLTEPPEDMTCLPQRRRRGEAHAMHHSRSAMPTMMWGKTGRGTRIVMRRATPPPARLAPSRRPVPVRDLALGVGAGRAVGRVLIFLGQRNMGGATMRVAGGGSRVQSRVCC